MDRKMTSSSSKELLYSEYTGATVAGHVLETLHKKSDKIFHEEAGESFTKKEKSETFERVRKLMSLIAKEQGESNTSTGNLNEKSNVPTDTGNDGGIEVIMEVNENNPESNIDAWFLLKLPKEQESNYSDDELERKSPAKRILDFSDSSNNTSDDESEQKFPIIASGFELNNNYSSNYSHTERALNSARASKIIKKSLNCFSSGLPSTSDDESERNFPVISNGFALNDNDSSHSSDDESKQNLSHSSNFVDADSSNSSDVKNGQCLSISTVKGNLNCVNKGVLQLPILIKENKNIIEMLENESSEDTNHGFVKHSSYRNGEKLSSQKKKVFNFILNDSEECVQKNSSSYNNQKQFVAVKRSDSFNELGDFSVLEREKLTVLNTGSSRFLNNKSADYVSQTDSKKRKLCVVEDEI